MECEKNESKQKRGRDSPIFKKTLVSWLLKVISWSRPLSSVTRSGDLLDFGQILNAFGNT